LREAEAAALKEPLQDDVTVHETRQLGAPMKGEGRRDNAIHVAHYPNSEGRDIGNGATANIRAHLRREERHGDDDAGATLIGNLVYGDAGHRM